MSTYSNAGVSRCFRGVAHARHAVRLLVEQHDIGDPAQLGAFRANIFFDVQDGGRVLLKLFQGEHMLQYDHLIPTRTGSM